MPNNDEFDAFLTSMTKAGQGVAKKDDDLRKAIDTLMLTVRQVYLGAKRAGFEDKIAARMAIDVVTTTFTGGAGI